MNDEQTLAGLEYIADSPSPEYGGFHPTTVEIANGALVLIKGLTERLHKCDGMAKEINILTAENRRLNKKPAERAIALLREGMESTGSGTLHYQKMRDAIELLSECAAG